MSHGEPTMTRFKDFATNRPLLFALFTILSWFVVGALFTGLVSVFLHSSFLDYGPQVIGTLAATIYVLFIAWRFGWLRAGGITSLGSWQTWVVALLALIYVILAYSFAFFGDFSLDTVLFSSAEARSIFGRQVVVGLVEEILFRGLILYAFVRVWGETSRGLLASIFLSAFLFEIIHLLQALAGRSFEMALVASLEAFISGVWWAAIVVLWTTVWPAVLLHTASNAAVLIKALSYPGIVLTASDYTLVILFQLPLVFIGLWWVYKKGPRSIVPDVPWAPLTIFTREWHAIVSRGSALNLGSL